MRREVNYINTIYRVDRLVIMIENILLGFLMYQNMTGYEIKTFIVQSTAHFYDASFGSIYPALKRLVKAGKVSVKEEFHGDILRKVYKIEDEGRKSFLQWLESPLIIQRGKAIHLIQLFFYHFLDQAKAEALIQNYIDRVESIVIKLQSIDEQLTVEPDIYQWSTHEYGLQYYQYVLDFYRKFLSKLQNTKKEGNER